MSNGPYDDNTPKPPPDYMVLVAPAELDRLRAIEAAARAVCALEACEDRPDMAEAVDALREAVGDGR